MNTNTQTLGLAAQNPSTRPAHSHSSVKFIVFAALALWFGLVSFLAARGAFAARPDSPPLPLFLGFATPLAAFCAAYLGLKPFRDFILDLDLSLITSIQAWRWAGLGFLSLYTRHLLPALFAFPAGLGDMAIGVTAPLIVLGLAREPAFATSKRFITWNILGIIDLFIAVSLGALCSGSFPAITAFNGNLTTAPMTQLPLILLPAYMVPIFLMLHLTALAQIRRKNASN